MTTLNNEITINAPIEKKMGKLHVDYNIDEVLKVENIAPTDRIKVIVFEDGEYKVKVMSGQSGQKCSTVHIKNINYLSFVFFVSLHYILNIFHFLYSPIFE